MKIIRYITFVLALPLAAFADKIADYPNVTQPASNQLFLVTSANAATNNSVSFGQITNSLRNAAGLTNLHGSLITDGGTALFSNSASFASAQQGTILTNNGTFDVTWAGNLTVDSSHNLNVTTFNVTTGNFGSLVLTNVDGSFWTNLNASELRSGTVPDARLSGKVLTNGVIKTTAANPTTQTFVQTADATINATIDNDAAPGFAFNGGDLRVVGGGLIGNGAGLTSLSGTAISSGTVADGRLSSNVPLMNASNYFSKNFTYATNQNQIVPDFSIPCQLMTTNAAFTFLAPVGVDLTKTEMQTTAVYVTNTTAVVINITVPANCHSVGTANCTNLTRVTFEVYAQKWTNAFFVPVF